MAYEGFDRAALGAIQHRQLTRAAEHLLGLCSGLIADGQLADQEVIFLSNWLNDYADVTTVWPGKVIAQRVRAVMADGVITAEERQDLLETLRGVCGYQFDETGAAEPSVAAIPFDDEPHVLFQDRTFCFTGRFLFGTRAGCERAVLQRGGVAVDNVTSKLEYLVVGTLIEPTWANTSYGRKIQKAIEYAEKGHGIAIIPEKAWAEALTIGK